MSPNFTSPTVKAHPESLSTKQMSIAKYSETDSMDENISTAKKLKQ